MQNLFYTQAFYTQLDYYFFSCEGHDSQYLRLQGSDGIITEKNELDELIFQHFSKQFDIDNTSTNLRNEENPLDSISKSLDDDDRTAKNPMVKSHAKACTSPSSK